MSLIADALKAAQRAKTGREGAVLPAQRPIGGFFSVSGTSEAKIRSPRAMSIVLGGTVLALAVGLFFLRGHLYGTSSLQRTLRGESRTLPPPAHDEPPPTGALPLLNAPAPLFSAMADSSSAGAPQDSSHDRLARASGRHDRRGDTASGGRRASGTVGTIAEKTADTVAATTTPPAHATGQLQISVDPPTGSASTDAAMQAAAALQRRDYRKAVDLYERAITASPRRLDLYVDLATTYRAAQELEYAAETLRRAVVLDSGSAVVWGNLGLILQAQGKRPEALAALRRATRCDPKNAGIRVNLAIVLRETGQLTEAKQLLDGVLQADPNFAEAHYALGQVLEDTRDVPGAIVEYNYFLSTQGGRYPAAEQQVRKHLAQLGARQ